MNNDSLFTTGILRPTPAQREQSERGFKEFNEQLTPKRPPEERKAD